ncbi:MAG: glucosamine-6-phosphate deaminase [Bacillota bacterium]
MSAHEIKHYNLLSVEIHPDRRSLGRAAGEAVVAKIRELLGRQARVRMVFAAAPSQNEFLETLSAAEGIDWKRVTAFHMDEYLGLSADAPQSFRRYLKEHLFDRVHPGEVHLIAGEAPSPEEECARYARLLAEAPIDIVCLGIGENGHLAFNDPPVADFADPEMVKVVRLDEACRRQQVHDGCFARLEAVPTHAITLTIPVLFSGGWLYCVVPGPTKREAVKKALTGPISTTCPASILRIHPRARLYLDRDAAAWLEPKEKI